MVARSPRLCKMLAISHSLFSQVVYSFDVFQDCWGGEKIEKDLRRTLHK